MESNGDRLPPGPRFASHHAATPERNSETALFVADGSVLVRAPIPNGVVAAVSGEPVVDDGWWALLFVDGDPSDVMEAYLTQAEALGFDRDEVPAGQPEFLREDIPADKQRYAACGVAAEGPAGWSCVGAAFTDGGAPCIHLRLVRREARGAFESTLLIRYSSWPDGCLPGMGSLIGDPTATPPPLPSEWPPLPTVGSVLDDAWGLLSRLVIEPASAVSTYRFDGPACGDTALLEVNGDPLKVLDAYIAQLEARTPTSDRSAPTVTRVDDTTELHQAVRAEGGGGDLYRAELVDYEDGPDTLVLSGCSG